MKAVRFGIHVDFRGGFVPTGSELALAEVPDRLGSDILRISREVTRHVTIY